MSSSEQLDVLLFNVKIAITLDCNHYLMMLDDEIFWLIHDLKQSK